MRYETMWWKKPKVSFDPQSKKLKLEYVARYGEELLQGFGQAAQEHLGEKFVSFEVREEEEAQVTSIEYVDQPTIEETIAVNGELDQVLTTWSSQTGAVPWV